MNRRTKLVLAICGLLVVAAVVVSLAPFSGRDVECDGPVFMAFYKVQMPKAGGGLEAVDGICGHDARMRLAFAGALGVLGLVAGVTVWVADRRNP